MTFDELSVYTCQKYLGIVFPPPSYYFVCGWCGFLMEWTPRGQLRRAIHDCDPNDNLVSAMEPIRTLTEALEISAIYRKKSK